VPRRAILFDLDDTLMADTPAALAAFAATAAAQDRVEAGSLALAARDHARELWLTTPVHPYCVRIGIASWVGLWCRFEGDDDNARWLRHWAPRYRRETWRAALADHGADEPELAAELGERFAAERRARHHVFADVPTALDELHGDYLLGLLTNGASCLQREKVAASGLRDRFAAVAVSAELGVGKPDPAAFAAALAQLDCRPEHAVMVGDSLSRDIEGALGAGLRAVWVNRDGRIAPPDGPRVPEIAELSRLRDALG
jgi:putative hydrolase of the HAD superfamily